MWGLRGKQRTEPPPWRPGAVEANRAGHAVPRGGWSCMDCGYQPTGEGPHPPCPMDDHN